jgi:hypothetical protein
MRPPSVSELKRLANAVGMSLCDADSPLSPICVLSKAEFTLRGLASGLAARGLKVASPPPVRTVLLLTGRQTEPYYFLSINLRRDK